MSSQTIEAPAPPAARSGEADPAAPSRRWLVIALLCAAQLLVVLDATIVNIALPSIQSDVGFSAADLQWVVNAYVLTFGGLLLLGGRAADIFARRRVFLAGMAIFSASSLACGLSSGEVPLIAARAVQGAGAAFMSAAALSILVVTFTEGRERNIALGTWGATSGVAGALGVVLGGALTSGPGWQWVFFINVPLGLAVAALSFRFVPLHRAHGEQPPHDLLGALSVTTGVGLLIFAIVRTQQEGWGSAVTLGCLGGAIALLISFLVIETRHRAPLVPLGVFRFRNLSGGNVVIAMFGGIVLVTFFFATLYMQKVLGYSPIRTGLAYLPMALVLIAASTLASRLIDKIGSRTLLCGAMTAQAAGLLWFAQIDADGSYLADVLGPSVVMGLGMGVAFVVSIAIATDDFRGKSESGLASGLANTSQQVGGALALAAISTVAFNRVADASASAAGRSGTLAALVDGYGLAFYLAAGLAVAGALTAAFALARIDPRAAGAGQLTT